MKLCNLQSRLGRPSKVLQLNYICFSLLTLLKIVSLLLLKSETHSNHTEVSTKNFRSLHAQNVSLSENQWVLKGGRWKLCTHYKIITLYKFVSSSWSTNTDIIRAKSQQHLTCLKSVKQYKNYLRLKHGKQECNI